MALFVPATRSFLRHEFAVCGRNIACASRLLLRRAASTAPSTSDLSQPAVKKTSNLFTQDHYRTRDILSMCGGKVVLVGSPPYNDIAKTLGEYDAQSLGEILPEEIHSLTPSKNERTSSNRLNEFVAGRVALRRAMGEFCDAIDAQHVLQPMPFTPNAGPPIPTGWLGSISHKGRLAGAVCRPKQGKDDQVGIDIELCRMTSQFPEKLKHRTCTSRELKRGNYLSPTLSDDELVKLRFSIKEALFKVLSPIVKRYVSFLEVDVYPQSNGTAEIMLYLHHESIPFQTYRAEWLRYREEWFVSVVYLYLP